MVSDLPSYLTFLSVGQRTTSKNMLSHGVVFVWALALVVQGFDDFNFGEGTLLCNATISEANASHVRTFNVSYPRADGSGSSQFSDVPDPGWAITVDQSSNATQTSFWFDTAGQNYSDDLSLRYDVCTFGIDNLPMNTIQLAQDDHGDCSSTFSPQCRKALQQRLEDSAMLWTR